MVRWIVGLLVALLVAILAQQNVHPVEVHLLFWQIPKISLALLLIGAAIVGAVGGWVIAVLDARRRMVRRAEPMGAQSVGTESVSAESMGAESATSEVSDEVDRPLPPAGP